MIRCLLKYLNKKSKMKNLQIDDATARKIYPTAAQELKTILEDTFGKAFFSQDICDRVNTMEDVYRESGKTYADIALVGLTPDEIGYRKAKLIFAVMNEEWVPDYDNPNQDKFELRWIKNKKGGFSYTDYFRWNSITFAGARLTARSGKIANHIGKCFEKEFNEFLV